MMTAKRKKTAKKDALVQDRIVIVDTYEKYLAAPDCVKKPWPSPLEHPEYYTDRYPDFFKGSGCEEG